MKIILLILVVAMMLVAASLQIHAQGTIIDQESATGVVQFRGNGNADGLDLQQDSPLMQSFAPSLTAINFVSFEFYNQPETSGEAATIYVNLYEGGTDVDLDTLLGTSVSVYLPNGFGYTSSQATTLDFTHAIKLNPGETYYLEPVIEAVGDEPWYIIAIGNTYPNGEAFQFTAELNTDFWFQEGINVVPEPTTLALISFVGLLPLFFKHRLKLPVLGMRPSSIQYWR